MSQCGLINNDWAWSQGVIAPFYEYCNLVCGGDVAET